MRRRVVAPVRDRCGRARSCASRRGAGRSRSRRAHAVHCSPNLTPMSRFRPTSTSTADAYRRRIRVETVEPGVVVRAARGRLPPLRRHAAPRRRRSCESVEAESHRWPWTTCPGRGRAAAAARGDAAVAAVHGRRRVDRPEAELHASVRHRVLRDHARGTAARAATRQYDLEIPRRDIDDGRDARAPVGRRRARAWRGRSDVERHRRRRSRRSTPRRGRAGSCAGPTRRCPKTTPSAAITLRRACDIGMGRGMDLDGVPVAVQLPAIDGRHLPHDAARRRRGRVPPRRLDPRLRRAPRAPAYRPNAESVAVRRSASRSRQAVDRFRRAAPRRDDHAGHAERPPSAATSSRDVDRAAEHDLERRRVAAVLGEQPAQRRDLRGGRLERVAHADPAVAEPRRAPQRGLRLAADEDRRPRLLHRLRFEHDFVEREELAVVRDRLFGPQPLADRDRFVDAPATRREVELRPRPTPPRATTRRCRTRSGRPRGCRRVCTPRAVVNGWRSPMLNTCVPSRSALGAAREVTEVRERVVDRRVGRHRRMVLARDAASSTSSRVNTRCSGSHTDS